MTKKPHSLEWGFLNSIKVDLSRLAILIIFTDLFKVSVHDVVTIGSRVSRRICASFRGLLRAINSLTQLHRCGH